MNKENPFVNSELTSILVVSDIERSKSFYVDVLGAEVFREYGGSSVVIEFLNSWILLVNSGDPTAEKPQTSFKPPQDLNSVHHSFTIRVQDCKKSYEILKNRGTNFLTPPYNWGAETRCFFRDPDGHLFEISEYKMS